MNYKLQLTAAEAEIVRTALLHYSNFAYYRAGFIARKGSRRADGTSYSAADVRAAQDAAMQANLIRSKIMPLDISDVKINPPGLPPLPLPRFHGTRPEQGSFDAHQLIDYANAAVARLQGQLKDADERLKEIRYCARRWMDRSDANHQRAEAADAYEKANEVLRQRLEEEKKLSASISRDCNNTALERNELWGKLDAAEQHVKILQEQVAEGKRQWDHVAQLLGVDGDCIDAVYEAAGQVRTSYRLVRTATGDLALEATIYTGPVGEWKPVPEVHL